MGKAQQDTSFEEEEAKAIQKKRQLAKTRKMCRREINVRKFRKQHGGKPLNKWPREALKAVCLYKKQKGDTPVPEKKVDLIEMYQERVMRPSPPCSDDEEEQGEGDISGKAAEIHLEESSRHEWAE